MWPICASVAAWIGIAPPWNAMTSRFMITPAATAGMPATARLHRHQTKIAVTDTRNMPTIQMPSRLPSCGTAAIASSSQ